MFYQKKFKLSFLSFVFLISCISCTKEQEPTSTNITPGTDPNFEIITHSDQELSKSNRKVIVFGIDIYAVSGVQDEKLLHAANLLAQYLDNDEDGNADNQLVLDKMLDNKAFLYMWKTEADFPDNIPSGRVGQDLGNDETNPAWHTNGQTGRFDAALEEVFHIVTTAGYESAYPNVFGTDAGTKMSDAMDIARGGRFNNIPDSYPPSAWYSYDDSTCDYGCQASEYIYWAMTSMLGAQENRLDEIGHEWKLNTPSLVQSEDIAAYKLLSDPQYKLPTVLPDGTYRN